MSSLLNKNGSIFNRLVQRYPELEVCVPEINAAGELLVKTAEKNKKILLCGNGGSAADADHIAGELLKSFCKPRPLNKTMAAKLRKMDRITGNSSGTLLAEKLQEGIQAISLTHHTALSTAFSNDVDPDLVFAQQCQVFGNQGDVFWGITTSGNAKNVCYAAMTARAKGLSVLGLTGENGGKLKTLCDICICVPRKETYEVQELHLPVYHALCLFIEEKLFDGRDK